MRFLRIDDVVKFTGLSKPSIYRLMREGSFPRAVRLGERAVAWTINDLEQWAQNRPSTRSRAKADGWRKC
jgi:prophage regulatory protein